MFVPSLILVSASASRAGSRLAGCVVRSSSRSLSGQVLVASFSSLSVARQFSRAWGSRVPARCRGCVVRRAGGAWAVSVPVAASAPVQLSLFGGAAC